MVRTDDGHAEKLHLLPGFFRSVNPVRHYVPADVRAHSWNYPWAHSSRRSGVYYFGVCGAVCMRPPLGHHAWTRPVCGRCTAIVHGTSQPGPGAPR